MWRTCSLMFWALLPIAPDLPRLALACPRALWSSRCGVHAATMIESDYLVQDRDARRIHRTSGTPIARLNHMPFPSVQRLIRAKSIAGIRDHVAVTVTSSEYVCEDCVNGKLTRASQAMVFYSNMTCQCPPASEIPGHILCQRLFSVRVP